jgi:hypothetical protein
MAISASWWMIRENFESSMPLNKAKKRHILLRGLVFWKVISSRTMTVLHTCYFGVRFSFDKLWTYVVWPEKKDRNGRNNVCSSSFKDRLPPVLDGNSVYLRRNEQGTFSLSKSPIAQVRFWIVYWFQLLVKREMQNTVSSSWLNQK